MIQLGIILALVTSLLGGGLVFVRSIREEGRQECRAEHQEAARMAELRSRERGQSAATKFERDKWEIHGRERAAIASVASAPGDGNCITDSVRDDLNRYIRETRRSGKPD